MSMRSSSAPRRVYSRGGSFVVCYGGVYFGPKASAESKINVEKEVTIEVLDSAGGKKRIAVTQRGKAGKVTETWNEKHLTFEKRASAE
jgi:hypothetical protein